MEILYGTFAVESPYGFYTQEGRTPGALHCFAGDDIYGNSRCREKHLGRCKGQGVIFRMRKRNFCYLSSYRTENIENCRRENRASNIP